MSIICCKQKSVILKSTKNIKKLWGLCYVKSQSNSLNSYTFTLVKVPF